MNAETFIKEFDKKLAATSDQELIDFFAARGCEITIGDDKEIKKMLKNIFKRMWICFFKRRKEWRAARCADRLYFLFESSNSETAEYMSEISEYLWEKVWE